MEFIVRFYEESKGFHDRTYRIGPCHLIYKSKPRRARSKFVGTGKLAIDDRIDLDGRIPSVVMLRPANSTSSWHNWNFGLLMTILFFAHNVR